MIATKKYKKSLDITGLASEFYDFVTQYLGLDKINTVEVIKSQLAPWFGNEEELGHRISFDVFMESKVHEKYRIALEFAAYKAGLDKALGYVEAGNKMRIVSGGRFWMRGCHPDPVVWIMRGVGTRANEIVAEGIESKGSIYLGTLNDWISSKMEYFYGIDL